MQPEWPIHVKYADGEDLVLDTSEEAETGLEWFDSEDGDATATVPDHRGRAVHLVVEALQLKLCELMVEKVQPTRKTR